MCFLKSYHLTIAVIKEMHLINALFQEKTQNKLGKVSKKLGLFSNYWWGQESFGLN